MQNILIIENHNISTLIGELHECVNLQIISYSLRSLDGLEHAGPVQKLSLNCCKASALKSLDGIEKLNNTLTSLTLKNCRGISSLQVINKLTNLKELNLVNIRASGMLLTGLTQLQSLKLLDCAFTATDILPQNHKLTSLTLGLGEATSLTDIIVPCSRLEIYARKLATLDVNEELKLFITEINFTSVDNIFFNRLTGIEKFYNLKKIRIKDVQNLDSLTPIMYLSKLEEIQLINVDMNQGKEAQQSISTQAEVIITNCGPRIVQSFVYAEKLKLRKVSYTDLSFLINPIYVNQLSIYDCAHFQSLNNISQFKSLQKLEIINCNLSSDGLDGFNDLVEQLQELTINGCNVSQLQFLYDVVHLTSLNLDDNNITDVGELMYLKYLPDLQYISMINNPISKNNLATDYLQKYLSLSIIDVRLDDPKTNLVTAKFRHRQKSSHDKQDLNNPYIKAISNLESLLLKKTNQTINHRTKYDQLKKDFIVMENQFQNTIYELKLQIKIAESDLLDGERKKDNEWRQWRLCDNTNRSSQDSDTELENCDNDLGISSDNLIDMTNPALSNKKQILMARQPKLSESEL